MALKNTKKETEKKPKESTKIELTKDYTKSKEALTRQIQQKRNLFGGVRTKAGSTEQEANPYEHRYYKNPNPNQPDYVISSDNKVFRSSSTNRYTKPNEKGSFGYRDKTMPITKQDLRKEFVKDSTRTMNERNEVANKYNVDLGNKKVLSEEDKQYLIRKGKAIDVGANNYKSNTLIRQRR